MTAEPHVAEALRVGKQNYWTAVHLTWVSRGRPLAQVHEVFDALGLIDPDDETRPRPLLPDNDAVIPFGSLGQKPSGPAADDPSGISRGVLARQSPSRDRSTVPSGLRDLPPAATVTKPAPVRRPPQKKTRPTPPVKKTPAVRASTTSTPPARPVMPTVDEVRRNGLTLAQTTTIRASDLPARPEATGQGSVTAETRPPRRRPGTKPKPREHGTLTGYGQHYKRHDLPVCQLCMDVYAAARERRRDRARAQEYADWLAAWMTRETKPGNGADFVADLIADMRTVVRDLSRPAGKPPKQERSA